MPTYLFALVVGRLDTYCSTSTQSFSLYFSLHFSLYPFRRGERGQETTDGVSVPTQRLPRPDRSGA